jgi:hypothetical protein
MLRATKPGFWQKEQLHLFATFTLLESKFASEMRYLEWPQWQEPVNVAIGAPLAGVAWWGWEEDED